MAIKADKNDLTKTRIAFKIVLFSNWHAFNVMAGSCVRLGNSNKVTFPCKTESKENKQLTLNAITQAFSYASDPIRKICKQNFWSRPILIQMLNWKLRAGLRSVLIPCFFHHSHKQRRNACCINGIMAWLPTCRVSSTVRQWRTPTCKPEIRA